MNYGIAPLGTHDFLVAGMRDPLITPLWPADGLPAGRLPLALPAKGVGRRDHAQREGYGHPHRPVGFLWRMPQIPLLLTYLKTAVLG